MLVDAMKCRSVVNALSRQMIDQYVAWGDKPNEQFPTRMVETIDRMGSVPMITWEPWVVDFDEGIRKNLSPEAEREYGSLAAIARGEYDFYIVPWAKGAAGYHKPIFLRFAHEMNDPYRYPWGPQNGNRPEDFGLPLKAIGSVDDLLSLPASFAAAREREPAPVCNDCPSTRVFAKFAV